MYIDPELRDRVYQLFSLEVPKMLQTIETELVTLSFDRSVTKVHSLLRAAHSIKGGAASLGLDEIRDLAHQVENVFRILDLPELPFDRQLEQLLFQLYDCLNQLITDEINDTVGSAEFQTKTQIVLAKIDRLIGHFVEAGQQPSDELRSRADLTRSIFEVDVAQSLARLERVLLDPDSFGIAVGEFRAQSEVFIGVSQLLNLPQFGSLAHATIAALDRHPNRAHQICCFALVDFYAALEAVLSNDLANCGRISPGFACLLAETPPAMPIAAIPLFAASGDDLFDLEQMFDLNFALDPILIPDGDELDPIADLLASPLEIADLPRLTGNSPEQIKSTIPLSIVTNNCGDELSLDFDLVDIFDLASPQSYLGLEILTGLSLDFDLVDIFDLASPQSYLGLEILTGLSLDFDLVDIFDLSDPAATILINTSHARRAEIETIIASIGTNFERLAPTPLATFVPPAPAIKPTRVKKSRKIAPSPTSQLSVRVALDRLDRMNNFVGELAIERHGLALHNEQVQDNLQRLRSNCENFQTIGNRLRQIADAVSILTTQSSFPNYPSFSILGNDFSQQFDSLELDRYSELHEIAQATIEQLAQIEEQIEDLTLFSTQSARQIDRQKQLLAYLRDDLMWARMLPLGEIINRFPRTLHDLSIEYHKPVDLKITGAGVLVDRATIDKLLDPLLHLLRNAFDHGIDPISVRQAAGKPERGSIEINAYHQGSQTVIEIQDDGGGIDLDRIKAKAIDLNLLTPTDAATATKTQLFDLLFTPGFSTTDRVTKLSGRGMGLDIVKAQMQTIKGTISIQSQLGRGTTFTLRIPLTLTIAQLMICQVGNAVYAFPADSIQRIIIPTVTQIEQREQQRFFHWHDRVVPIYHLADLLLYSSPLPERTISHTLRGTINNPSDWLTPILIIRTWERMVALQIDRTISEQELTIVPFGKGITPPSYSYGCTILGDGVILPVIDLHTLIRVTIDRPHCPLKMLISRSPLPASDLILVVDDSVTTRQSLCLSLEKFGYRALPAKDGQEALQLLRQKASELKLVVCDVEMPNMNGFEFLNIRRQDVTLTHIPVVMLTSRSNTKHRQFATHLGAIDYFIKPYIEQDLIAAIGKLISNK
jgi:two-component system, chemotaxis family, sensor histidine kinase and response regulator PixL